MAGRGPRTAVEGNLPAATAHQVPDRLGALLVASSHGDTAAFADLYEAVAPRIYGLALRVLGDAHQSEEVTQEVLLQVWQTSGQFDPGRGTALTWVLTLTHRRAVDRVRASDAGRRRDTAHAQRDSVAPFDETAAAAHASLECQTISAALTALSPTQRRAIELAYYDGHTHVEVSRLMQVPLGTAKSRIRDGLLSLRGLMSTEPAEPEPAG